MAASVESSVAVFELIRIAELVAEVPQASSRKLGVIEPMPMLPAFEIDIAAMDPDWGPNVRLPV